MTSAPFVHFLAACVSWDKCLFTSLVCCCVGVCVTELFVVEFQVLLDFSDGNVCNKELVSNLLHCCFLFIP